MSKTTTAPKARAAGEKRAGAHAEAEPAVDGNVDEAARMEVLARAHGLDPERFSELITESRTRARRNRRRVPDARLDELVRGIGAA